MQSFKKLYVYVIDVIFQISNSKPKKCVLILLNLIYIDI